MKQDEKRKTYLETHCDDEGERIKMVKETIWIAFVVQREEQKEKKKEN